MRPELLQLPCLQKPVWVIGFNPLLAEGVMRATRQLGITLPNDMADAIRCKVAAGEYATERET